MQREGRTFGVPGIPYPEPGWAGEAGVATAGSPDFPGTPVGRDGRAFGGIFQIMVETPKRRRRGGSDVIASDHGRVIGGRRHGVPGIPYPEPGWAGEGGVATAGSPRFPGTPIPQRKKWGP